MENEKYIELDRNLINDLLQSFKRRAGILGYTDKTYIILQHEFILGAIRAIDMINNRGKSCILPAIHLNILRGEKIEEIKE